MLHVIGHTEKVPSEALLNIAATLKWQFHKHRDILAEITTPAQHKAIAAFVQAPGDYFDAEPTFKQSYAPQSGRAIRREDVEYAEPQQARASYCVLQEKRMPHL